MNLARNRGQGTCISVRVTTVNDSLGLGIRRGVSSCHSANRTYIDDSYSIPHVFSLAFSARNGLRLAAEWASDRALRIRKYATRHHPHAHAFRRRYAN